MGKTKRKYIREYRWDIGEIVNDKFEILEKRRYKNGHKSYLTKCLKCGYIVEKTENHLLQNHKCGVCDNRIIAKDINSIYATNKEVLPFFVNIEDTYNIVSNSEKKVKLKCPLCGNIQVQQVHDFTNRGFHCKKCGKSQSLPEKIMYNILSTIKLDFIKEKSFDWLIVNDTKRRFDYYFEYNNQKYIIETDGGWHTKDNTLSGLTKEQAEYIDNEKDRLANEHNINVIRIDCKKNDFAYIKKSILNSELSNILDLSHIEWDKIEDDCNKSDYELIRRAWKRGLSVYEICNELNFGKTKVISALKNGAILGLCNYDKTESRKRGYEINRHKFEKSIYCIEIDKFFKCADECCEYFNDIINVNNKFLSKGIRSVAWKNKSKGNNSHYYKYKGYTFLYRQKHEIRR